MSGSVSGNSRRLAGIVSFMIGSAAWDAADAVEYVPNYVMRETVKGQSRVEGYSEMPNEGYISATLRDRGDATVYSLNQMTGQTITVQAANGKTITAVAAWQTGEIKVGTKDGTFTIRFDSDIVSEQTP